MKRTSLVAVMTAVAVLTNVPAVQAQDQEQETTVDQSSAPRSAVLLTSGILAAFLVPIVATAGAVHFLGPELYDRLARQFPDFIQ